MGKSGKSLECERTSLAGKLIDRLGSPSLAGHRLTIGLGGHGVSGASGTCGIGSMLGSVLPSDQDRLEMCTALDGVD